MNVAIVLFFFASVILAALKAVGVGGRVDLGWLAIACFFAAVGLPALDSV